MICGKMVCIDSPDGVAETSKASAKKDSAPIGIWNTSSWPTID